MLNFLEIQAKLNKQTRHGYAYFNIPEMIQFSWLFDLIFTYLLRLMSKKMFTWNPKRSRRFFVKITGSGSDIVDWNVFKFFWAFFITRADHKIISGYNRFNLNNFFAAYFFQKEFWTSVAGSGLQMQNDVWKMMMISRVLRIKIQNMFCQHF